MKEAQHAKKKKTQPGNRSGILHHIVVAFNQTSSTARGVPANPSRHPPPQPPPLCHPLLLLRLDKLNTIIHVTPSAGFLSGFMLTIIMVCFESHNLLLNLQYEKVLLAPVLEGFFFSYASCMLQWKNWRVSSGSLQQWFSNYGPGSTGAS